MRKGWIVIAALLGALILVSLMGRFSFTLGAFDLDLSLSIFNHGSTEVVIPPVGTIAAKTHYTPLKLSLTLTSVNINQLEQFLGRFQGDEAVVSELSKLISRYLWFFVARLLLLAFIGGGLGIYFTGARDLRTMLTGGIIGLVIIGLLLAATGLTYNVYAFNSPQFSGILEAAPWAFRLVNETLNKVDQLGEQLQVITDNLYLLFRQIETLPGISQVGGEVTLLHVSDIHNNPAAVDFIAQVIDTFQVDLVVDTGDITDYGTPLEASLTNRVGHFPVPYLFVPGNHDSPEVIEVLKTLPNCTVLEEGVVELAGITIAGIADPSSRSTEMNVAPEESYDEYIGRLRSLLEQSPAPDVVAAHHPRVVEAFIGTPLLLTGHTHQQDLQVREGSVISNAGTTGAAGIRGLQGEAEVPFSLTIIYFQRDKQGKLQTTAADLVKVFQFSTGFSLDRRNLLPVPEQMEIEEFPIRIE